MKNLEVSRKLLELTKLSDVLVHFARLLSILVLMVGCVVVVAVEVELVRCWISKQLPIFRLLLCQLLSLLLLLLLPELALFCSRFGPASFKFWPRDLEEKESGKE